MLVRDIDGNLSFFNSSEYLTMSEFNKAIYNYIVGNVRPDNYTSIQEANMMFANLL